MPQLKRVQFQICTGEMTEAEYAIFGSSCVLCDARDSKFPSVNSHLEDAIAAINKQEQLNLLGEPSLQFYELQVRKHSPSFSYRPGHFVFMLVWENRQPDHSRFSWYEVQCPPIVIKTFCDIIGRPPVQMIDNDWQSFEDWLQEGLTAPTRKVEYEFLQGTGIEARWCNDEEIPLIKFGLPNIEPGTWRAFLGVTEQEIPTTPGRKQDEFKQKVIRYAKEMLAWQRRHKELLNYRPN